MNTMLYRSQPHTAPFTCIFCGLPSFYEPIDQTCPPDYCHPEDHGYPSDEVETVDELENCAQ